MNTAIRKAVLGRACIMSLAALWLTPSTVDGETVRNSLGGAGGHIGANAWGSGNFYGMPGTIFTPSVSGELGVFTVTVYGEDPTGFTDPNWTPYTFQIRLWNSVSAYQNDPLNGQAELVSFNDPTNANHLDPFGSYDPGGGVGPFTKHRFEFDLTSSNIPVNAGQEYVIGFMAVLGDGGSVFQSISTTGPAGEPDIYATESISPVYLDDLLPGEPTDWFASKLTIIEDQPTVPAASTWGLVSLSLLVLTAGSLVLRRNVDGARAIA